MSAFLPQVLLLCGNPVEARWGATLMPALQALPCLHTLDVDEELLGDFQAALPGKGWDRETEKGCWRQGVKHVDKDLGALRAFVVPYGLRMACLPT